MTSIDKRDLTKSLAMEDDDSLSVYNEKELEYLDKYLPMVKNAFDEDELYEIILDCDYNDEKIKKMITEKIRYLKAKGTQYGWNVVDRNRRLKPVEAAGPVEEKNQQVKKAAESKKGKKGKKGKRGNGKEEDNQNYEYYADYGYDQGYDDGTYSYDYAGNNNYYNNAEGDYADYYSNYYYYHDYNNYDNYSNSNYSGYKQSKQGKGKNTNYNNSYGYDNNYNYADNYEQNYYNDQGFDYSDKTGYNNYTDYTAYNKDYKGNKNNHRENYSYTNKYKKKRRPKNYYTQHNHYYQNNYYGMLKDYEPEVKKPVEDNITPENVDENIPTQVVKEETTVTTEPVITEEKQPFSNNIPSNYIPTEENEEINVNKTDIENLRSYFDRLKKYTIFNEPAVSEGKTGIYEKFQDFTSGQMAHSIHGHGYGSSLPGFNPEMIEQSLTGKSNTKSKLLNNLSINSSHALEITSNGSKMETDLDGKKIVNFSFVIQGSGKKSDITGSSGSSGSNTNSNQNSNYNNNKGGLTMTSNSVNSSQPIQGSQNQPMYNQMPYQHTPTMNPYQPFDYSTSNQRYNPYMSHSETYNPEVHPEMYQQPMYDYQQYAYYQMPYRITPMQYPGYQMGYGAYQDRYQFPQEMYNPNSSMTPSANSQGTNPNFSYPYFGYNAPYGGANKK